MIQKRLIFLLLLISFKASFAEDECSSSFEQAKKESCQKISDSSSGIYCDFIDGQCKDWYKECAEYAPSSNFDSNICTKITPSDPTKKCYADGNQCKEKDRECSELSEDYCSLLIFESLKKRCVYKDGKCEEHSNSCSGLDSSKCEKNIPSNFAQKCVLEGSTCTEKDRTCSDFIEYKDFYHNGLACDTLKSSSTSKVCTDDDENNKCKELYNSCGELKKVDDCRNEQLVSIDWLKKCVWNTQSNSCEEKEKVCSDYKVGEGSTHCLGYTTTEYPNHKTCIYTGGNGVDKCEEQYISCDHYNTAVTDAGKRKDQECKTGNPSHFSRKCVLDKDNVCKEVNKECKEYDSENDCISGDLDDESKKCIFLKGKCVEEYKNCEAFKYDSNSNKNKETCESITPIDDKYYDFSFFQYDRKKYKCVYSESSHACNKEEISKCEDYKGYSQSFCTSMPSADYRYLQCIFMNDQCITKYSSCESYQDIVTDESKRKKEECESIVTDYVYKTCKFDENKKKCKSESLPCSSYKGNSSFECQQFSADDKDSACFLVDGKCVQQKNYDYKNCDDYLGKDKSICESIQPKYIKYNDEYYYDLSRKCVYNTEYEICEEEKKTCSEARNADECKSIKPSVLNKECVYKDNSCVEQYDSCESYATSGETIDQTKCENIILSDNQKKCTYSSNTCKTETKKCSDFKVDLFQSSCYAFDPSDDTKKCTYSNNACTITDKKTCLELFGSQDATKEICEAASTTSDKRSCALSSTGNGCEEVNKQNNKSFAGKGIHLSKILFVLVCLWL